MGGSGGYTCTSTLILSWIHWFHSLATVATLVALAGNASFNTQLAHAMWTTYVRTLACSMLDGTLEYRPLFHGERACARQIDS